MQNHSKFACNDDYTANDDGSAVGKKRRVPLAEIDMTSGAANRCLNLILSETVNEVEILVKDQRQEPVWGATDTMIKVTNAAIAEILGHEKGQSPKLDLGNNSQVKQLIEGLDRNKSIGTWHCRTHRLSTAPAHTVQRAAWNFTLSLAPAQLRTQRPRWAAPRPV